MKKYFIGTIAVTLAILAVGYFLASATTFHDIFSVICGIWIGYVASYVHHYYYAKKLK
jgi:glycopeptide antibiotics resistance protein